MVVFALVAGAILFVVIRRRAVSDSDRPVLTRNLELGYVAIIAATVIVLVALSFRTGDREDALGAERPATTIDVTAFQWGWRFDYADGTTVIGNARRPPILVVPIGEPVRFRLTSRDVIHAFWIPDLRFKRDAFPNRETAFDLVFSADSTGPGHCAEFCGIDHSRMDFRVLPLSPASFRDWLRRTRGGRRVSVDRCPEDRAAGSVAAAHRYRPQADGRQADACLRSGSSSSPGVLALLMRSELAQPGLQIVSADGYDQLFTLHGSLMIYFVVTPLALALGLYFVPLQVGAADDRCAPARRARLLADRRRGADDARRPADRRGRRPRRLDRLPAALRAAGDAGHGDGHVGDRGDPRGRRRSADRGKHPGDDPRRRAPQMDITNMSPFTWAMFFTDADDRDHVPGADRGDGLLLAERSGTGLRLQRRPDRLPAPVLVLRPPGRLRDVLPLPRCRGRGRLHLLPPASRRLRASWSISLFVFTGLSMGVWAHHMFTTGQVSNQVLRARLPSARDPGRHRVLRPDRDDGRWGRSCCGSRCCSRSAS